MAKGKTGPATAAGKEAVSRNALTHGMASTAVVIEGVESQADWLRHLDGIVASIAPEGDLEHALARRVRAEDGDEDDDTDDGLSEVDPERVARAQPTRLMPAGESFEKILRYETHLHRQCLQTLHEIEALQARRRGELTPLARLDISAPPLN